MMTKVSNRATDFKASALSIAGDREGDAAKFDATIVSKDNPQTNGRLFEPPKDLFAAGGNVVIDNFDVNRGKERTSDVLRLSDPTGGMSSLNSADDFVSFARKLSNDGDASTSADISGNDLTFRVGQGSITFSNVVGSSGLTKDRLEGALQGSDAANMATGERIRTAVNASEAAGTGASSANADNSVGASPSRPSSKAVEGDIVGSNRLTQNDFVNETKDVEKVQGIAAVGRGRNALDNVRAGANSWTQLNGDDGMKLLGDEGDLAARHVVEDGFTAAKSGLLSKMADRPGVDILAFFAGQKSNWNFNTTGKIPSDSPEYGKYLAALKDWGTALAGRKDVVINPINEFGNGVSKDKMVDEMVAAVNAVKSGGYDGAYLLPSSSGYNKDWLRDPQQTVDMFKEISRRTGVPLEKLGASLHAYNFVMTASKEEVKGALKTLQDGGLKLVMDEVGRGGIDFATGKYKEKDGVDPQSVLDAAREMNVPVLAWSLSPHDGHGLTNGNGSLTDWGRQFKRHVDKVLGGGSVGV